MLLFIHLIEPEPGDSGANQPDEHAHAHRQSGNETGGVGWQEAALEDGCDRKHRNRFDDHMPIFTRQPPNCSRGNIYL